jgi:acetolactate synthase-1/2/3 large subunit
VVAQDNLFPGNRIGCNSATGVSNPDFKKLADAYNFNYCLIKDQAQLVEELPGVLQTDGPVFCEVLLETEYQLLPRAQSHLDDQGQIVSCKLETLRYK